MTETARLQAYLCGIHTDDGWTEAELVIAGSPEAAVAMAYPKFPADRLARIVAGEDSTYSVERYEHGDRVAWLGPCVVRDMATMREAGLCWADDRQCEWCEARGDDVCADCGLCPDCRVGECEACAGRATMVEVRICGASDDLIEVEGAITEEFSCFTRGDDPYRYLAFSDGTVLRAEYDREGCWRFVRVAEGSAAFAKVEAADPDGDYSDRVTLAGDVRWVVFGKRFERAE